MPEQPNHPDPVERPDPTGRPEPVGGHSGGRRPEPVESSRLTQRPASVESSRLTQRPEPVESSRLTHRPEPVETSHRSARPDPGRRPEPVEGSRPTDPELERRQHAPRDTDPLPSQRLADEEAAGADPTPEPEWWEDERMPWKGKPGKWDLICWFGIMFMGLFSLVMIPLRAYLVVANPVLQAGLTGSRSALVVLGVTDHPLWALGLVLGIVSVLKFEWVYFLAGRLWGRGLIDMMVAQRSARTQRLVDKLEALARRYGVLALVISWIPLPLPTWVATPAVAIAGMRWRTWWTVNIICAIVLQCCWVGLGFWLGEPARVVVEAYARISGWVALGLVAVIFVTVFVRQSRQGKAAAQG